MRMIPKVAFLTAAVHFCCIDRSFGRALAQERPGLTSASTGGRRHRFEERRNLARNHHRRDSERTRRIQLATGERSATVPWHESHASSEGPPPLARRDGARRWGCRPRLGAHRGIGSGAAPAGHERESPRMDHGLFVTVRSGPCRLSSSTASRVMEFATPASSHPARTAVNTRPRRRRGISERLRSRNRERERRRPGDGHRSRRGPRQRRRAPRRWVGWRFELR